MRVRRQLVALTLAIFMTVFAWYSVSTISSSYIPPGWPMLHKQFRSMEETSEENVVIEEGLKAVREEHSVRVLEPFGLEGGQLNADGGKDIKVDSHGKRTGINIGKAIPNFDVERISRSGPKFKRDEGVHSDKWIVLTTVAPPTEDVKFLANISGWKVVVVGDTKTPKDWSYPNCVYLSVSKQLELGLQIADQLPYKHYSRKNVGYLYAMAHGATVIYETDDDNRPLDKLSSFELQSTTSGLMYAGRNHAFNPYRHFGQPTLWPRGFPLSQIGSDPKDFYKLSYSWPTPAIQQGVVNGDPDMDAIFRLTRKITLKPLDVKFDPAAPSVTLPPGVFSPFNSQNTLFLKQAFWATFIPATTTFRICDIWRGYWAQRLLWEIDGYLGFFPANAYQQRNAHNYMADMDSENGMYLHTDRLLSFLYNWVCPINLTFFQCVYKLSLDMAAERFWLEGDVKLTKHWLEDLVRIGYREPKRVFAKLPRKDDHFPLPHKLESDIDNKKYALNIRGTVAQYIPNNQIRPEISPNEEKEISQVAKHMNSVAKLCPGIPSLLVKNEPININAKKHFDDILLIIVFNWPHYSNVIHTEVIYRHLFPNILYCGANATEFILKTAPLSKRGLSFAEAPISHGGFFAQWCTVKAMQMNYNVKGYLSTSDDVLLNVWNLPKFDKTKLWSTGDYSIISNINGARYWTWWNTSIGVPAFDLSMASLTHLSRLEQGKGNNQLGINDPEAAALHNPQLHDKNKQLKSDKSAIFPKNLLTTPSNFIARLQANTGHPDLRTTFHSVSDTYYIPARLKNDVAFYFTLFTSKNLFSELCVPTTFLGLEELKNIEVLNGRNLYLQERLTPWAQFDPNKEYLHPVKWSQGENLAPFCSAYLPLLLTKGYR